MKCPFCKADNDKVIESRSCQNNSVIRRRRECLDCGIRFTTHEIIEEMSLKVVKKSGERTPFLREKIATGINKACEKRPISIENIEKVIDYVLDKVTNLYEKEVPTAIIGEFVMEALRNLDQVAYIRFASVYKNFQEIDEFVNEIQPIIKNKEG